MHTAQRHVLPFQALQKLHQCLVCLDREQSRHTDLSRIYPTYHLHKKREKTKYFKLFILYCSKVPDRSINWAVPKIGTPIHLIRPDPDGEGSSSGRSYVGQSQIKDPYITQCQQFLDNTVSRLVTKDVWKLNILFVSPHDCCPCSATQQLWQLNAAWFKS